MYNNHLVLRTLTSPYGDITVNSVLTHQDIDSNFIFLKSQNIKSGFTTGDQLILVKNDDTQVTVDLASLAFSGSGTTVIQYFSGGTGLFSGGTLTAPLYGAIISATTITSDSINSNALNLGLLLTSASTLTINTGHTQYSYYGLGDATWTLPSTPRVGDTIMMKNKSSAGIITLVPSGGQTFYTISQVSTMTVNPGVAYNLVWDGVDYIIM